MLLEVGVLHYKISLRTFKTEVKMIVSELKTTMRPLWPFTVSETLSRIWSSLILNYSGYSRRTEEIHKVTVAMSLSSDTCFFFL